MDGWKTSLSFWDDQIFSFGGGKGCPAWLEVTRDPKRPLLLGLLEVSQKSTNKKSYSWILHM